MRRSTSPVGKDVALTAAHTPQQREIILGIAARIAAVFCIAGVSAGAKWMAAAGTPLLQIIFCRNAFAFIPIVLYIAGTSGFGVLKTRYP